MKKLMTPSPLFARVTSFCAKHRLITPTDTVVVGFSGGPDSLFLLHTLASMLPAEQIIAAHLDHGWRPESKSEAAWCQAIAEKLGVRFVAGHLQDYASQLKNKGSKEDSARQARRRFFTAIAHQHNAHTIALAHHADDQLETFFIRLMRGAGIQGLSGMRPRQGVYIRPLLELSKHDIISFLDAHNTPYLIDPSNMSLDYLRNRIRHTLIPALITCDPRADKNIHAAITHLQEVDTYLDEQAHKAYDALTTTSYDRHTLDSQKENRAPRETVPVQETRQALGNTASLNHSTINIKDLQELHPLIRHRVLILWLCSVNVPFTPSKAFFTEIERFLFQSQTSSSHQIAPQWAIRKHLDAAHQITAHLTTIS